MTFQQIQLAVEIASKGSISEAARSLSITQPNASQTVKKLEEELGFAVFKRTEGGIVPTEEGYRFLSHAETIVKERDAIQTIGRGEYAPRLRIGTMNYTPAVQAFVSFCEENREAPSADLVCLNVNTESGIRLLKERMLDAVVSLQLSTTIAHTEKLCKENRLSLHVLKQISICVRVRKDHPLIQSGELDGTAAGFRKLSRYPYIEYMDLKHIFPKLLPEAVSPFDFSYAIYTDERESRLELVSATNAYALGCKLSEERLEQYGLTSVPVWKEYSTLVVITRKGDEELPAVKRYFELLDEKSEE